MNDTKKNEKIMHYDNAVTKIANGNFEGLTDLFNSLKRDIFLYAYSITGNYHLSEEVLQETFIRIQTKAYTYCKGTNAKAWILTIARNLAFKEQTKNSKELSISEIEDMRTNESVEEQIESIVDLESAFSVLTEEERQIIILRAYTGLKHKEIANIMDLSSSNIRKKYSRSLEKLYLYFTRSEKNV